MAHWYYAKGDQQHGPVSDEEMQRLVASGTIAPGDEVWRDGMDDWRPLSQIPQFSADRPMSPPLPPGGRGPGAGVGISLPPLNFRRGAKAAGPWLLVTGFLLVVWAKGCDSIGARDAVQIKDDARTAEAEFEHQYAMSTARLEVERDKIEEDPDLSDRDKKRLQQIDEQLDELRNQRDKERRELSGITWERLKHNAATADADRLWWAYYHEVFFVFGSMILIVGLIIVASTGDAPQRWLCLVMLAIITFSIFVGGFAWIGTLLPR